MKRTFTILCLLFFGITLTSSHAQEAWGLRSITEDFQVYWLIDSKADLIWLTDTVSLDASNNGTNDFASLAEKWAARYRLDAHIVFDPDSSKVDWNNNGTVNFENSTDSLGLLHIGRFVEGEFVHFTGHFDGQYHPISNIFQNTGSRSGLFGGIKGATIENVTLENIRIVTSAGYNGTIVGRADEVSETEGVRNVIRRAGATGSMIITNTGGNIYTGGITGRLDRGDIIECFTILDVRAIGNLTSNRRVSGIVGQIEGDATIKDSYSVSTVSAWDQTGIVAGRVAGPGVNISNSYAAGQVLSTTPDNPRPGIGIFIGLLNDATSISSSYYQEVAEGITAGIGNSTWGGTPQVVGMPAGDFASQANFSGWDFDEVWKIGDVEGQNRPYLQWQDIEPVIDDTSVRDFLKQGVNFKVYPNPVKDVLYVTNAPVNAQYAVVTLTGQIIESGKVTHEQFSVNTGSYVPGVYLIKIEHSAIRFIKK